MTKTARAVRPSYHQQIARQGALLRQTVLIMGNHASASKLSAKELAERAGLSLSTIYRYRNNQVRNTLYTTMNKILSTTGRELMISKIKR